MTDYDSIEKLKSLSPHSCQDIRNDDGYLGQLACTERVYEDSDKLLESKLNKYSIKIDKLEDIDISTRFKIYQDQWLKYRISKCNFIAPSANVIATPHRESATWKTQVEMSRLVEENIAAQVKINPLITPLTRYIYSGYLPGIFSGLLIKINILN